LAAAFSDDLAAAKDETFGDDGPRAGSELAMTDIWVGMAAGLAATVILSALMLMKDAMKLMPQMDMIGMISGMMKTSRMMGWLVHLVVGAVVYGLTYAFVFAPHIG
jgi:hypothetical protein